MVTLVLSLLGIMYIFFLVKDIIIHKANLGKENIIIAGVIGLVTNFFDALGIGSFATTTLLFKITKFLNNDKILPGTLNTAHTIPILVQAFVFITVVNVDGLTLISMMVAAMIGSWIGARIILKIPEKKIQLIVGTALAATALIMALRELGVINLLGDNNEALGLRGGLLIVAVVCNFILGALMTAGVGLYAPCMALVYMLGLNPLIAFPIMMGSCAALMPVASIEFIKAKSYSKIGTIGISIGGVVGVWLAVQFVTSINLSILVWVIIAVILYTSVTMFLKGLHKDSSEEVMKQVA